MREHFVGIVVILMLIGLLVFSSITLAEEGKWSKKSAMSTTRVWLSTSMVNGKIYAIGGVINVGGGKLDRVPTVEEYDPVADKWTKKADMPTARSSLSASVVNGKVYAIGGGGIVEEYDPVMDKWTKKADMPTARAGLSTSVVNGKIYAIGGSINIGGGKHEHVPTIEEYDPVTNKWTKKADMPTARESLATSASNGKIYAIGGAKIIGRQFEPLPTVEEYDPVTNKWTKKADMLTARWGLSTSAVGGKIYAVGGLLLGEWPPAPLSTVEEYDPGFTGEAVGIEVKGKLVTSWGKIKSQY